MNTEKLKFILSLEERDYGEIPSKYFENLVVEKLSPFGDVKRQVTVENRYDGRRGRIDIVFTFGEDGEEYPIEIDRKRPRKKSFYKVKHYNDNGFIILRSPYKIIKA